MKIKKIGHCCLLIRTGELTILTDPGMFSAEQNKIEGIDIVLITHEHADHLHIESVEAIMKLNPRAEVITNSAVGKKLAEKDISFSLLEGRSKITIKGIIVEAFDGRHEEIYEEIGQVQNTGYFIADKLFYPGDSFFDPARPVEILALPVAGPWCRLADATRYGLRIKPKKAFPVHDGNLRSGFVGLAHQIPARVLTENGIEFITLREGGEMEF